MVIDRVGHFHTNIQIAVSSGRSVKCEEPAIMSTSMWIAIHILILPNFMIDWWAYCQTRIQLGEVRGVRYAMTALHLYTDITENCVRLNK